MLFDKTGQSCETCIQAIIHTAYALVQTAAEVTVILHLINSHLEKKNGEAYRVCLIQDTFEIEGENLRAGKYIVVGWGEGGEGGGILCIL